MSKIRWAGRTHKFIVTSCQIHKLAKVSEADELSDMRSGFSDQIETKRRTCQETVNYSLLLLNICNRTIISEQSCCTHLSASIFALSFNKHVRHAEVIHALSFALHVEMLIVLKSVLTS